MRFTTPSWNFGYYAAREGTTGGEPRDNRTISGSLQDETAIDMVNFDDNLENSCYEFSRDIKVMARNRLNDDLRALCETQKAYNSKAIKIQLSDEATRKCDHKTRQ